MCDLLDRDKLKAVGAGELARGAEATPSRADGILQET